MAKIKFKLLVLFTFCSALAFGQGKPIVVVDGFFVSQSKTQALAYLGKNNIKDTLTIVPDSAEKIIGKYGSQGLFIIKTTNPKGNKSILLREHPYFNNPPTFYINGQITSLQDVKKLNPKQIDSIIVNTPLTCAKTKGFNYIGGIIHIWTKENPNIITKKELTPVSNSVSKTSDNFAFQHFLQITDNILEEIPKDLKDKFIGNKWDDPDDPYRKFYSEQTKHYKLYGNYLATFEVSMGGVTDQTILASYTSNGKMIDHIVVGESSDMDMSATSYSFQGFNIFADSLVQVYYQTTRAKNYHGMMPDSISLDDLDSSQVIETVNYSYYVIQPSGKFKKVFPIQPILNKKKLKRLTKSELRIKRNEFFARLGYIFKSPDLAKYFAKFSWYKPKYNNVTDKLTAFDIYNIRMIKQIEDGK